MVPFLRELSGETIKNVEIFPKATQQIRINYFNDYLWFLLCNYALLSEISCS